MAPRSTDGRVAGRYVLRRELGRGGMGVVWLADDALLEREVAVKEVLLPTDLEPREHERARARVLREARAAARLNHANVTMVFDVLEEDGRAWIVLEYVDAPTLADVVAERGPLPPADAAAIGVQLLDALTAAHAQGIVHRDVKPRNVMVLAGGQVKLTDFGIATLQDDPALTRTGVLLGSPSFMAPEQATEGTATAASDLWALGATLYHAVEGVPPFDRATSLATLAAVTAEPPRPLLRGGPLEGVVLSLLSKEPTARPRPATVRADLVAIAAGRSTGATVPLPPAAAASTLALDDLERTPATAPTRRAPAVPAPAGAAARAGRSFAGVVVTLGVLLAVAAALLTATRTAEERDVVGDETPPVAPDTAPASSGDPADAAPPPTAPAVGVGGDDAAVDEGDGDGGDARGPERPRGEGKGKDKEEDKDEDSDEGGDRRGGEEAEPALTVEIGDTGATVDVPEDWTTRRVDATRTDYVDPAGGRYLRVDWTDDPPDDAVADWRRQSDSFRARKSAYEEIRIEATEVQGHPAALWEYRYREGGVPLHAYNVGIHLGDHGAALNFQTHQSRWDESQDLFDAIVASFDAPD